MLLNSPWSETVVSFSMALDYSKIDASWTDSTSSLSYCGASFGQCFRSVHRHHRSIFLKEEKDLSVFCFFMLSNACNWAMARSTSSATIPYGFLPPFSTIASSISEQHLSNTTYLAISFLLLLLLMGVLCPVSFDIVLFKINNWMNVLIFFSSILFEEIFPSFIVYHSTYNVIILRYFTML